MRMPFSRTGTVRCSAAVIEQRRLFGCADQPARQRARLDAAVLIELAEMRHRLLNHPPTDPNAAHQPPATRAASGSSLLPKSPRAATLALPTAPRNIAKT